MVKYDSKVVCVSEGEVYLIGIKFKTEGGKVLEISKELEEAIGEAIEAHERQVYKKSMDLLRSYSFTTATTVAYGSEGVGILIKETDPTKDTRSIVNGYVNGIWLNLQGEFERIVGERLAF